MISTEYRQWVVASRPEHAVSLDNFRLETVPMPEPGEAEVLVRTDYLMVNPPAMFFLKWGVANLPPVPVGNVMWGTGVGTVVASNHASWPVGERVSGALGWSEYGVFSGSRLPIQKIAMPDDLSATLALHILGPSGQTAYFGFAELGQPRIGDTVLVSAAAGAVGSLVCQLALNAGCNVIGILGSGEKGEWLRSLGVHHVINYKQEDIGARLAEICPGGVDIYYDNVGGAALNAAVSNLAHGARVILCGATSQYQATRPFVGPSNYFELVHKSATMRGFELSDYATRVAEATGRLLPLVKNGRLQYKEDVIGGFERVPEGLLRSLEGKNFGTPLVRVSSTV